MEQNIPQQPISQPPSTPVIPSSSKRFNPKILIPIGIACVLLLIVGFVVFSFMNGGQNNNQALNQPLPTNTPDTQITPRPVPKVVFRDYTGTPQTAQVASLPVYTLKQRLSTEETQNLAGILSLTQIGTPQGNTTVFSNNSMQNRGILSVNTSTGAFSYESFGVYQPASTPLASAQVFLNESGLQDGTILCDITYKVTALDDLTFVECHRGWNRMGAPLVTLPGLINMGENERVTGSSVGTVTPDSPRDASIAQVSTGQNGYARPNDFNTITFATTSDGQIRRIESNIRWTERENTRQTPVISATDALSYLKNGQVKYALTLPTGTGTFDWGSVYPNDIASAAEATITETTLVYLENLPDTAQSEYIPYYVFRGTATLDTGYTVSFAQAVPAAVGEAGKIAEVPPESLQLGTFNPPTRPPRPSVPLEQISSTPSCVDPDTNASFEAGRKGTGYTTVKLNIPGYGTLDVFHGREHTYFYSQSPENPQGVDEIRSLFFEAAFQQVEKNLAKYLLDNPTIPIPGRGSGGGSFAGSIAQYINQQPNSVSEHRRFISDIAPLKSALPTSQFLDTQQLDKLQQRIDTTFYGIGNDRTKLQELASRPDLFPPQTLRGFNYVFVYQAAKDKSFSCYISGKSPFLFLYPETAQKVKVTSEAKITYSDPGARYNSWNVFATPNGILSANGIARDGIYYEYDPQHVNFTKSAEGFVFKRTEVDTLTVNLGNKLGLNEKEIVRLTQEVSNALRNSPNSKYIIVSFAAQDDINKQLPLNFDPKPKSLHRIMLLLTPTNKKVHLPTPRITPVKRDGFTVIELGAFLQE